MRRLIVCADGTWNTPDEQADGLPTPTNVCKMKDALAPASPDGSAQLVYYHDGIGTGGFLNHFLGGVSGQGIDDNIKACYTWLIKTYQDGDEMFLFGFSRGAYTVRSLAGLIRKCGLLKPEFANHVDEAYDFYRNGVVPSADPAVEYRAAYSLERYVTFIGVWDTVGALGIPVPALKFIDGKKYQFHDVTLSSTVKYAYQALAIDEERVPFAPCVWEQQAAPEQTLEQVWFTGAHSNVGGGCPDPGLSDLTFAWMQTRAAAVGLGFNDGYISAHVAAKPDGPINDSMSQMYLALGRLIRQIRTPRFDAQHTPINTRESLHRSAFLRFQTPSYSPKNITDFFTRVPSDSADAVTD